MSSDANFKRLKYGVTLVPNPTTLIFAPGDIDYSTDTGKFNFYGAGGSSPGVTENGTQTLTNKTILVGSNSITGTPNTAAQFNVSTGFLESSITTATELSYVHGVTSSIQTQINSLQPAGSYITQLNGDITAIGPGNAAASLVATSNSTLTTLSVLSLPGSQVTGNISGNATNVTGIVGFANGGTNATTAAAGFNNLSPMTTTGDLEYEVSTGVAGRLPIGINNQVLKVVSGLPAWATFTALTNPMTTTGDLIYSSDNLGTPTRLSVGSTGQVLEVVGGIPTWTTLPAPNYWSGYNPLTNQWNTTSTSLADFTSIGTTPSIVERQGNGISVTAAAANLPGIIFTPSSATTVYQISASFTGFTNGINGSGAYSLTDNNGVIISQRDAETTTGSGGESIFPFTLTGLYVSSTTSPVTIKLKGSTNNPSEPTYITAATSTVESTIEWSIVQVVSSSGGGSSYTFSDSLVNTSGNVTLVGDTASPGASMYYGTNASSVLGYYAVSGGGSGANTSLSNLITTSINESLVPAGTLTLGGIGSPWITTYTNNIQSYASDLSITTLNQTGSNASNNISIRTGNTVNGGSGYILLEPGTPSGAGAQGAIDLIAASINLQGSVTIGTGAIEHVLNTATTTGSFNATFTNSPVAGNPAGYIQIVINGSTHYIPYF